MGNLELVDGLDAVEYFLANEELLKAIDRIYNFVRLPERSRILGKVT